MITPIEIRQHTFKKAFQGYNKDEVQNYLNTLSSEWERMVEDYAWLIGIDATFLVIGAMVFSSRDFKS